MSERRGRIKAERELREAKLRLLALTHDAGVGGRRRDGDEGAPREDGIREGGEMSPTERCASVPANANAYADEANEVELYPLRPIGRFRSSFSCRNGTPRQPQLVPLARGRLTLRRHVPPAALEGLEAFSHAWIIYVFHENTDLHNAVGAGDEMRGQTRGGQSRTTSRAKVRVPRLNGERRGVFATRTPHRPLPVGLSLVEVYAVDSERGVLDVGGADLVDGTPVLDVKPYLPFCEALAPRFARARLGGLRDGPFRAADDRVRGVGARRAGTAERGVGTARRVKVAVRVERRVLRVLRAGAFV